MAKINPGGSYVAPTVVDGTMYTRGAGGGVQAVPQTSNRVRGMTGALASGRAGAAAPIQKGSLNRSPFSAMDALVSSLDAQYENLADKSPWIGYADNISGQWALCASCMPDEGGKKLFRQYNFNRTILGLNIVTVPISDNAFAEPNLVVIEDFRPVSIILGFDNSVGFQWYVFQAGRQLMNPVAGYVGIDEAEVVIPTDPAFAAWSAVLDSGGKVYCCFDQDGAPGLKGSIS